MLPIGLHLTLGMWSATMTEAPVPSVSKPQADFAARLSETSTAAPSESMSGVPSPVEFEDDFASTWEGADGQFSADRIVRSLDTSKAEDLTKLLQLPRPRQQLGASLKLAVRGSLGEDLIARRPRRVGASSRGQTAFFTQQLQSSGADLCSRLFEASNAVRQATLPVEEAPRAQPSSETMKVGPIALALRRAKASDKQQAQLALPAAALRDTSDMEAAETVEAAVFAAPETPAAGRSSVGQRVAKEPLAAQDPKVPKAPATPSPKSGRRPQPGLVLLPAADGAPVQPEKPKGPKPGASTRSASQARWRREAATATKLGLHAVAAEEASGDDLCLCELPTDSSSLSVARVAAALVGALA